MREARSAHHYMILPSSVADFKRAALKHGIPVVEVPFTDAVYADPHGYLYVTNNMEADPQCTIDWDYVKKAACDPNMATVDPARNNRRTDFGYCGHRNSERHANNMGLSKPRMLNGTTLQSSKDLFLAMTRHVRFLQQLFDLDIYSDKERNSLLSEMICINSIIEALACTILEADESGLFLDLLRCHRDLYNCLTSKYSWLITVTKLVYNEDRQVYTRLGCHAYGKQSACDFVEKIRKYSAMISDVTAMVQRLPFQLRTVTGQNVSMLETTNLPGTHLSKMCRYYQTIGTAIENFVLANRRFSNGLRLVGGLLLSACTLSHKPLLFYEWVNLFASDITIVTGHLSVTDNEQDVLAYRLYREIKRRIANQKLIRASNGFVAVTVNRLQPTVGTLMEFEQFTRSVDTFERMVWEVSARHETDPRFLVRNTEYVVDALVALLCLPNKAGTTKKSSIDNGLYGFRGAGHLVAQMIIGVTARLGLFPPVLATFSRITPTNWCHWCVQYSTLTAKGHVVESEEVLRALDVTCAFGGDRSMSEEATCKKKGTEGRFADVNPQGVPNAWLGEKGTTLWIGIEPGHPSAVQVRPIVVVPSAMQLKGHIIGNRFFDNKYNRETVKKKKPAPSKIRLSILDHFPVDRGLARDGIRLSHEEIAGQLDVPRVRDVVHALAGVSRHRLDPEIVVREALGLPTSVKQSYFLRFKEATNPGDLFSSYACAVICRSAGEPFPYLVFPSAMFELYDHDPRNRTWVCPKTSIRYFADRQCAIQYALLYFIFVFRGMCGVHHSARILYMLPDQAEHNPTKRITSFSVFYEGRNANKGMQPFLVAVRHVLGNRVVPGGLSYYLLNDNLVRTSGTLLSRPPRRTGFDALSSWHGQYRIVLGVHSHHGPIPKLDEAYFGSLYNLRLCFEDGSLEMLPVHIVKRHMPELVIEYALMHDLSNIPPFRGIVSNTTLKLERNIRILSNCLEKAAPRTVQTSHSKNRKKRMRQRSAREKMSSPVSVNPVCDTPEFLPSSIHWSRARSGTNPCNKAREMMQAADNTILSRSCGQTLPPAQHCPIPFSERLGTSMDSLSQHIRAVSSAAKKEDCDMPATGHGAFDGHQPVTDVLQCTADVAEGKASSVIYGTDGASGAMSTLRHAKHSRSDPSGVLFPSSDIKQWMPSKSTDGVSAVAEQPVKGPSPPHCSDLFDDTGHPGLLSMRGSSKRKVKLNRTGHQQHMDGFRVVGLQHCTPCSQLVNGNGDPVLPSDGISSSAVEEHLQRSNESSHHTSAITGGTTATNFKPQQDAFCSDLFDETGGTGLLFNTVPFRRQVNITHQLESEHQRSVAPVIGIVVRNGNTYTDLFDDTGHPGLLSSSQKGRKTKHLLQNVTEASNTEQSNPSFTSMANDGTA